MQIKLVLTVALVVLVANLPATALAAASPLADADNGFGFKLLQLLSRDSSAQNIFISPYSASTVMQMVGNGAAGQTKTEMQSVLGTTNLSDAGVNAANKKAVRYFNQQDTKLILLSANNAIWYRPDFTVNPDFIAEVRDSFEATVDSLNFANPRHAVNVINHWAEHKTHGKITHLADDMIDPDQTQMFLANAVYFKAKWADPFDVRDTRDQPFYLHDGSQKTLPMMAKSKTFTYCHGTDYQAVRLPYLDDHLSMYVFLPDTNSSPENLLSVLNGDNWRRIIKPGFSDRWGTLVLPKFKLNYSVELKEPLQSLGIKTAFDANSADFSGISSNSSLCISSVVQKTFVEVKEEGTEAAAVTGMRITVLSGERPPQDPFEMIVNRPFLFLIEDNQTGIILFMGVVFNPQSD